MFSWLKIHESRLTHLVLCMCGNCRRRFPWRRNGQSRRVPIPSRRSRLGHGKCRAPLPRFSLPPLLQHHQDSLPPLPPAAWPAARRPVAPGSSPVTSSASPQPPDRGTPPVLLLSWRLETASELSWPVIEWAASCPCPCAAAGAGAGGCGSVTVGRYLVGSIMVW